MKKPKPPAAKKEPPVAKEKQVDKFGPLDKDVRVEHVLVSPTSCAIAYYDSPGSSPNAFNLVRGHEYVVTHISITSGPNKGKCKLQIEQGPLVYAPASRAANAVSPPPPSPPGGFPPNPGYCQCAGLYIQCPTGKIPNCSPSVHCVSAIAAPISKPKKR